MSSSLVKLVDLSLLPAALMVIGKLIGLIITVNIFSLPWTVTEIPNALLSNRPGFLPQDIVTASTYSDLIMYLVLAIGFSVIIVLATKFHETHIHPQLLARLSNNNLMGLVKSSFDIYHAASIWLVFIWISVGVIWVNVALGKTTGATGLLTLGTNIILTVILLQDVYQEIELSKKNLGQQNAL
jgi:hypothetical protein